MRLAFFGILFCVFASVAFAQPEVSYVSTAKHFLELMEQGKYHEAYLLIDSSMTKIVTEQKNTDGWKDIHKKLGALRKQTKVKVQDMKPYTSVFLTCEFENAYLDLKVVFKGSQMIVGYFFIPSDQYVPPLYTDTNAIIERKIEVRTGEFVLSGILTLPKKIDHFPCVILVQGSGSSDRDETIGPNKPFKDLALGLAARGIATIRYDKRTFVYGLKSAVPFESITLKEETVDDGLSALRLAQSMKEIDPKKIFLLGHSLGALVAPRIAKEATFIAGIIFMAGNARSFEDVIADQMAYILPLQLPKKQADSVLKLIMVQVERIRSRNFTDTTSGQNLPFGLSPIYWKDIKNYDQVSTARSLNTRMLFLQGEKDYQVTMKDFDIWKKALASKDAQFISYPGLYHLFMPGEGKPADYEKSDHVAEKVINDISRWIGK